MNIFKILKTIFSFAISFVSFANVWRRPGQDDAFPKSRLAPSLVGSPPEATTPKIVVLHFDICHENRENRDQSGWEPARGHIADFPAAFFIFVIFVILIFVMKIMKIGPSVVGSHSTQKISGLKKPFKIQEIIASFIV